MSDTGGLQVKATTTAPKSVCYPNPCENNGMCSITKTNNFVCLCNSKYYTGEMKDINLKVILFFHERFNMQSINFNVSKRFSI